MPQTATTRMELLARIAQQLPAVRLIPQTHRLYGAL